MTQKSYPVNFLKLHYELDYTMLNIYQYLQAEFQFVKTESWLFNFNLIAIINTIVDLI